MIDERWEGVDMRFWLALSCVFSLLIGATAANAEPPRLRDAGYSKVHAGSKPVALTTGFNIIDRAALPCVSGAATCQFGISAMVILNGGDPSNPWSICAEVEGSHPRPPCSNQPGVNGQSMTGNSLQIFSVPQGNHKVSLKVYVSGPATLEGWSVVYQAYPN